MHDVENFDIETALSRNTDPSTSHEAEARFKSLGLGAMRSRQLLHAICHKPDCTSSELADVLHELYPTMTLQSCVKNPSKRGSDLRKKGLVESIPKRLCRISQMPAAPWRPTKAGKLAMGYAVGDVEDQQDMF
jgi:hypothetical protein